MSVSRINQVLARELRQYAEEIEALAGSVDNAPDIVADEYTGPVLQLISNRMEDALHELAECVRELIGDVEE